MVVYILDLTACCMLILEIYKKVSQVYVVHHSSLQEIASIENVLYGAGSELIRSEFGAYGEKILGCGSNYVRNNISVLFE